VIAPGHRYKTGRGADSGKAFLPPQHIGKEIRGVFHPRFSWRPCILRACFDTELLIESKGKITHDFRMFFTGRKRLMGSKYTTNKGMLPEVLLPEMRESFARSEEFLGLENTTTDKDPALEQKEETHHTIHKVTSEQMDLMLEALRVMQGANNMTGLATAALDN